MTTVSASSFFGGKIPPAPPIPAAAPTPQQGNALDVAIGAAKGAGTTIKSLGGQAADAALKTFAGPVASAIPGVQKTVDTGVQKLQDTIGLTDKNLTATNDAQRLGKGLEIAAEFALPFAKAAHLPSFLRGVTGKAALIPEIKAGASIEDVAKIADATLKGTTAPDALKNATDKIKAPVTFKEKLAGLAPDVKARIQGKGKLLSDYLNIADARNNSDLVPTPLEYGASFASQAVKKMEGLLSSTGSTIGAFRNKIATYQAPREAFNGVRSTFEQQLNRLNLTVQDGAVKVMPGKIAQTVSDSEISAIQSLYDDLNTVSQNPNLENLIDFRSKLDNKINFEKSARDVSSSLDPLSRTVRSKIASVAENIVGKSQAQHLEEYSKFMQAFNDLRSYTDRNAGGEFLLKRVFSERGGDPRAVMQTIKKFTGIDLMDHAMMAKIATELGGNYSTQGLFRQEITKAGLDAVNLLKGNPVGAVNTLLDMGAKKLINTRKIFQKAAQ